MRDVLLSLGCVVFLGFSGWGLWSGFARGVIHGYTPIRRDRSPVSFWMTMLVYAATFALLVFFVGFSIIEALQGRDPFARAS